MMTTSRHFASAFALCLIPIFAYALPFQFVQEGLVQDNVGRPIQGDHRVDVRLFKQEDGRLTNVFSETHAVVTFINGYYAIMVGSEQALTLDVLTGEKLFLGIRIDQGQELEPRTEIANVPSAMHAEYARDVIGSINPSKVIIDGNVVIDEAGKWVGDPTGLQGPQGAPGEAGPQGPQGPQGAAGGNGSPDTPAEVLAKVMQVDGADSLLDADTLDGLQSTRFMRTDANTGTTGDLSTSKTLTAKVVVPTQRIEFANDGRASNGIILKNHRIKDVDRLSFADPGPNEGILWTGTEAKVVVSPLDDANQDGALRLINDTAVALEADEIQILGKLKLNGAESIINWADAASQQGTTALDLANRNVNGINMLRFNDPGTNEGILWNGSQARIFVAPLADGNSDGYLRLVNDEGISLESEVRVTNHLKVAGRLGVGTTDPKSIIHARDDSATETGLIIQNWKAGANTRPQIELQAVTTANQGAWAKIQASAGIEAGGADASNHGGLKVITSTGGNGTPQIGLALTHHARLGIGTESPRGVLHAASVDARTRPVVVDGVVPGIYLNDTEGSTATGARYDSFTIEADGNRLYIGSKDKGNSLTPGSGSRNFQIQSDGKVNVQHSSTTGIALDIQQGFMTGHMIQSNWSGASWSHNLLFNADKRFTVTQSGPATFPTSPLFDGKMGPQYPGGTPTMDNPQVITIEGLPGYHTQAGTWIGWTTRYWPSRRFKVEIYDTYANRNVWKTVADYKDSDYPEYGQFMVQVRDAVVNKIRYTFYTGTGSDGRLGISELFFIHPEAVRPYEGLLAASANGEYLKGPMITSNRSAVGLEYNLLFNAHLNYTVTQSGPAGFSYSTIFDGKLVPNYPGGAPTEANPQVVTISGLPGSHTQAGTWIGWTTRYWPAKRFKIEIYDTYSNRNVWKTVADYQNKDFNESEFMVLVRDAVINQIRFTFYKATGSGGRIGVSELFFLHPEATTPYHNLLAFKKPSCGSYTLKANEDVGEVIGRYTSTHQCMSFRIPANTTVKWNTYVSIPSRADYSLSGTGWRNGAGNITSTIEMRTKRTSSYGGTTYSCNARLNTGNFTMFSISGIFLDEKINSTRSEFPSSHCRGLFNVGESAVVSLTQSRGHASESVINFQGHKHGRAKFGWTYINKADGASHDIYLARADSGWNFAGHGGIVSRSHCSLGGGVSWHDTSRIQYLP